MIRGATVFVQLFGLIVLAEKTFYKLSFGVAPSLGKSVLTPNTRGIRMLGFVRTESLTANPAAPPRRGGLLRS